LPLLMAAWKLGPALAAHPGVDKVAFTGSTEVGKLIVKAAAHDLKRVSLELGGRSPNVVFADADLETAVPSAANGDLLQPRAVLLRRLAALHRAEGLRRRAVGRRRSRFEDQRRSRARCGDGDASACVGRAARARHRVPRVRPAGGRAHGVRGAQVGDAGYFVAPTVLDGAGPGNKVYDEEIFGPVVTAIPFKDVDQIGPAANETVYGLAAGVWTNDLTKAHRLIPQLRAGTVWVNTYNIFDAALPFGGYKQSGWGREMGEEVIHEYTETKSVCIGL
jgi:phenylacetaldehyde dehydrogenase